MQDQLFEKIKSSLLNFDPTSWAEKHITLEGKPYRINGNGYKPLSDILRYIAIKAVEKDSKPIVVLKSRQTGMTVAQTALDLFFMASGNFGNGINPPIKVAHIFPTLELRDAYSKTKLNSMINGALILNKTENQSTKQKQNCIQTLIDKSSDTNNSLGFKQFIGGSHLWVESAGMDGSRLMGKSLDVVAFDECQRIPEFAIGNINKTLTKSSYGPIGEGVQIYFGTPLQRGSVFWKMWNNSTQQYFHLGCDKCKKYFPLYTPGTNDWENILIYGTTVRCTHCGFEQEKKEAVERGKWVATKDLSECQFVGFHLNQLFIPEFTKEKILSEKPGNSPINTERVWNTEILGEFWSGDAGIITVEQIREICGDPERKFKASISPDDNLLSFLGIDIGQKNDLEQLADGNKSVVQGQSYSTAVVLTVSPGTQRFYIDYAVKFKRNDLPSKIGLIEQLMRQYSINLAVMDLGYTHDLSEILQTKFGARFLCSQSSNRVNNHIKYNNEVFPKVITFEKDYWITDIYEQMKKGNIRFPMGSYEKLFWLIQHCTNMEISPTTRGGEILPHYVKSSNNDGLMALLNAYLAYRFTISEGFSNNNNPTGSKKAPPVIVGYVPRRL